MEKLVTKAEFLVAGERARAIIATWPRWKQIVVEEALINSPLRREARLRMNKTTTKVDEPTKESVEVLLEIELNQAVQECTLNKMCRDIHRANVEAGWWSEATNPLTVPVKLLLAITEICEGVEGDRCNKPDDKLPHHSMIAVELADAVIRIADLCGYLGVDLGTIMREKAAYNSTRADHKPENRIKGGGKRY